ncbi:hypothetical protein GQ53DRAFT_750388 [Thozetella sp. PMI_491]|nr:hypothetical protein GQ53DRAFT_750388 [Thozetella sp. PMI_491]
MHAQSLNKIHLKQLEALKHGHLQADEQLGLQQEAERMELRAKQQAAVDRVMASQGKQKLDDYTLAEDNVLRMLLAPLDVELQRQFTALLAKQKEAKSELLKSQKEKLESLQAQQATRSKEMGLKVSDELPGWADAYRRELEEKAKSKPKQVEEPPNPFCSGYCGRRRR